MSEDWTAIAAEVDAAIRSVADVSQPGGFPATLRETVTTIPDPAAPWEQVETTLDYTVYVIEGVREIRDIDGTTILQTRRTLTISATGKAPAKTQLVAVGIASGGVTASTVWNSIIEVRPLAPAGVAVLYEIDLGA